MPASCPDWFPELSLPGCKRAKRDALHTQTKSDILLGVLTDGPDMGVEFQYCTDLFNKSTIKAMADTFTAVLAAGTAAPDTPLSQLPGLVSTVQRDQLQHQMLGEVSSERNMPYHLQLLCSVTAI
jgi:hypothetical protein